MALKDRVGASVGAAAGGMEGRGGGGAGQRGRAPSEASAGHRNSEAQRALQTCPELWCGDGDSMPWYGSVLDDATCSGKGMWP